MKLIDSFITRYEREYDFYDKVCRKVETQLDELLSDAGIRAIVTSRAKSPNRLRNKLMQRNIEKKYKDEGSIYNDIADLAGVRIALYFPDSNLEVDRIIKESFTLTEEEKIFPKKDSVRKTGNRISRFPGYVATHYRVNIKPNNSEMTIYHKAIVEIQVASVLMHAWSEVEHDLVYKPLSGSLSDEEYAILDEINGLVLSGEIALERLKHAGVVRSSKGNKPYSNHYELAASMIDIYEALSKEDERQSPNLSNIGRVNVLLDILKEAGEDTPEKLKAIIEKISPELSFEAPFAEIVISYLLDANPKLMMSISEKEKEKAYSNSMNFKTPPSLKDSFFEKYENMYELLKSFPENKGNLFISVPDNIKLEFHKIRDVRNRLAHGRKVFATELIEAYQLLDTIKAKIPSGK